MRVEIWQGVGMQGALRKSSGTVSSRQVWHKGDSRLGQRRGNEF